MRHYFGEDFEVFSAGTKPTEVNPTTVKVMGEAGVDIGGQKPEPVELFLDTDFDYLITVCDNAKETCPVFPGKIENRLHWSFEDPAEARGTEVEITEKSREIRDRIKDKILEYFKID